MQAKKYGDYWFSAQFSYHRHWRMFLRKNYRILSREMVSKVYWKIQEIRQTPSLITVCYKFSEKQLNLKWFFMTPYDGIANAKIRKNVNAILVILVWPHPHPVGKSTHLIINSNVGEVKVYQRKLWDICKFYTSCLWLLPFMINSVLTSVTEMLVMYIIAFLVGFCLEAVG